MIKKSVQWTKWTISVLVFSFGPLKSTRNIPESTSLFRVSHWSRGALITSWEGAKIIWSDLIARWHSCSVKWMRIGRKHYFPCSVFDQTRWESVVKWESQTIEYVSVFGPAFSQSISVLYFAFRAVSHGWNNGKVSTIAQNTNLVWRRWRANGVWRWWGRKRGRKGWSWGDALYIHYRFLLWDHVLLYVSERREVNSGIE